MHRRLPTFASISATALAIVVASAFPAHAQNGTWSSLPADAPNLGPRREFGAIFDRANQRYLTFDGFNGNNYGLYILFNDRSEEHTSELQSRFGISYAVFCLKKKTAHLH